MIYKSLKIELVSPLVFISVLEFEEGRVNREANKINWSRLRWSSILGERYVVLDSSEKCEDESIFV